MDEKNPIDAAFERIRLHGNVFLFFKGDEFGPGVYRAELQWWKNGQAFYASAEGDDPGEVLGKVWAEYQKAQGETGTEELIRPERTRIA